MTLQEKMKQLTRELYHVQEIIRCLDSYIDDHAVPMRVIEHSTYYKNLESDLYRKIALVIKQIGYNSAKEYRK